MKRLSNFVGKRVKFQMHSFKYEGTFLGVGKKKGTNILGLLFEDVYEAIGKRVLSWMLVHPDEMFPTNNVSGVLIKKAKLILKEHHHTRNENIYYPPHQIKVLTATQISKLEKVSA